MMNRIESQCKTILQELQAGVKITQRDALELCGSSRLAARVHDLKAKGHDIKSEMITVTSFGRKTRCAQYSLAK